MGTLFRIGSQATNETIDLGADLSPAVSSSVVSPSPSIVSCHSKGATLTPPSPNGIAWRDLYIPEWRESLRFDLLVECLLKNANASDLFRVVNCLNRGRPR